MDARRKFTSNYSIGRFACRARAATRHWLGWLQSTPAGWNISAGARRYNGSTFTIFGAYPTRTLEMQPIELKSTPRTIRLDMEWVKIEDIVDVADGSACALLSDAPEFRSAIARGAEFVDRLLREDGTIYGVTTGFGDSCTVLVQAELA